jgi:predicted transposase/invertase (TIGR01784 family)
MNELNYLSHDEKFRAEYEARQKLINDENSAITVATEKGIAIGEERGELKKAKEMALKLLAKEMDITDIAEITGLSKTEVSNLEKASGK